MTHTFSYSTVLLFTALHERITLVHTMIPPPYSSYCCEDLLNPMLGYLVWKRISAQYFRTSKCLELVFQNIRSEIHHLQDAVEETGAVTDKMTTQTVQLWLKLRSINYPM